MIQANSRNYIHCILKVYVTQSFQERSSDTENWSNELLHSTAVGTRLSKFLQTHIFSKVNHISRTYN